MKSDVERISLASTYQFPSFGANFHPSMQNWSTFQLIYQVPLLKLFPNSYYFVIREIPQYHEELLPIMDNSVPFFSHHWFDNLDNWASLRISPLLIYYLTLSSILYNIFSKRGLILFFPQKRETATSGGVNLLRGRMHQLGTVSAFQWLRLLQDTSASAHEATLGDASGWISLPSLAPCPTSLVYTDGTPAPTMPL
jgi:hypothetical protein